jgi:hypothetical protein
MKSKTPSRSENIRRVQASSRFAELKQREPNRISFVDGSRSMASLQMSFAS